MGVKTSHFIHLVTLLLILQSFLLTSSTPVETNLIADQYALLALKAHITFDPHGVLKNWTIPSLVCHWIGVTCGRHHHRVIGLNISSMGFVGSIPAELGNLSFLASLDVKDNNFWGILPENLARLQRLRYIRLSYNNFIGEIPPWFSSFPQLQFLSLRNNIFTSLNSFIHSFSNESKLATLYISFNPLQGEIPKSIGNNLVNLKELHMEGNGFLGTIPPSIMNMSNLEILNLENNSLHGMIPETIGSLQNLIILNVQSNQLSGSLPPIIFNISTLDIIAFTNNQLFGFLPDDMCLQLPKLSGLYLANNKITGHIPSNFSLCSQLQSLSLSYNNITGAIPKDIGSLEMLQYMAIAGNELTGKIPSTMGSLSNLVFLLLMSNKLIGEIPSSICNLSSIQVLDLSFNSLEGTLPNCLGNLSEVLVALELSANHFQDHISMTFTKNCALQSLSLSSNHVAGVLPQSLANCTQLKILDIRNNEIQDSFPMWLGILSDIRVLTLSSNKFHGTMPDSNGEVLFPKLSVFDISNNELTGYFPTTYFNNFEAVLNTRENGSENGEQHSQYVNIDLHNRYMSLSVPIATYVVLKGVEMDLSRIQATFTMIDLSNNKFHGNIPHSIGNLTTLRHLNLSHNALIGHIPETLGFLTMLEALDLSLNHLQGEIPWQLSHLTFLAIFNVSYNNLSGSIPQFEQILTFENSSYIENFGLCGPPLTKKCEGEPSTPPHLMLPRDGANENIFDGITWQGVLMGYGFGLLIGGILGLLYF